MDRRLLVSAEDVVNRIVQEHVVGVENHAPRVAEDGVHPLALEALEENLGAGQPHGNTPSRGRIAPVRFPRATTRPAVQRSDLGVGSINVDF